MTELKNNIPIGLLLLTVTKSVIITPSIQDAIIIAVLVALTYVFKKTDNEGLIEEFKKTVKSFEDKQVKLEEDLTSIKSGIAITRLTQVNKTHVK